MLGKIKSFFMKVTPSKRKLIQLYAALLYNANLKGFITGDIFKGDSKSVCLPGMNCYSCPGAIGACPLGSIQAALAESKTKAPTYVLGIILLYCIIFGRTICGWLCPVGLLQELLYKIRTPKLKKNRITRILSWQQSRRSHSLTAMSASSRPEPFRRAYLQCWHSMRVLTQRETVLP